MFHHEINTSHLSPAFVQAVFFFSVRSFTGMDRNWPNYRNGPPEWTLTCAPEYFLCTLLGQNGLK